MTDPCVRARVRSALLRHRNVAEMNKIINSLALKIPARDLQSSDWRVKLQAIFGRWLPIPAVGRITSVNSSRHSLLSIGAKFRFVFVYGVFFLLAFLLSFLLACLLSFLLACSLAFFLSFFHSFIHSLLSYPLPGDSHDGGGAIALSFDGSELSRAQVLAGVVPLRRALFGPCCARPEDSHSCVTALRL